MSYYQIPNDPSPHWLDDDNHALSILPSGYKKITETKAQSMIAALIPAPTVHDQIYALEATITQRRIREAVLGTDNGWLAIVDLQIAELRALL